MIKDKVRGKLSDRALTQDLYKIHRQAFLWNQTPEKSYRPYVMERYF